MSVIQVPKIQTVEAEIFYANRIVDALAELEESGKDPVYMPQLIDARITSPREADVFQNWWTTPSVRVTGKNRSGEAFVVYAHVPTTLGTAKGVEATLPTLRNGAGEFPQEEFWGLLDRADNESIMPVPYEALRKSSNDVISVKKALEHPQVIPFLGGKERATRYLPKHEEVYSKNIGVWHSDDLDENTPRGRLLFLGNDVVNLLDGNYGLLDDIGRFLGVSRDAVGVAPKIQGATLEQVLKVADEYVPQRLHTEFQGRIAGLYK